VTLLAFRSRPREAGHIALISFPIRVNSLSAYEREAGQADQDFGAIAVSLATAV
jgi:hypothetical protein